MRQRAWMCMMSICLGVMGCVSNHQEVGTHQEALDTSMCPPGSNIIIGTPGDDVLIGTNGPDCILGLGGNDHLEGGNGDDVLVGGPGDDVLMGGNGDDILHGDEGNDLLLGGHGADTLNGGPGNDVLVGDRGADVLNGGDGDDVIDSGLGNDTVSGGPGTDQCTGTGCESPEAPVSTCSSDPECASGRRCVAGLCVACIADSDCDDSNVCTSDSCQPALGCRHPPVADGTPCLDNTVCNGAESCLAGTCAAGTPLTCSAGFACDPSLGCVNVDECSAGLANCDPNATCHDTIGSFFCTCNTNYEGDGHTCTRFCEPIVVNTGVTRCVRVRGGSITLYLDPNDPSSEWTETYVQSDEPEVNFCGPTAGKNLLFWYGADVDYFILAGEMRTNTWDFSAVFAAVFLLDPEPISAAIFAAIISDAAVKAGTLPGDMRNVISNRAPAGHGRCAEDSDVTIDEIRGSLSRGNPVIFLESQGEGNLHWAVVTGVFGSGSNPTLLMANSSNRSFTDFQRDLSLSRVGNDIVRAVLSTLFGVNRNTLVRVDQDPSSCN